MDNTATKKYIRTKLIHSFPIETEIIGNTILDNLLNWHLAEEKGLEIFSPKEGKNLELESIIGIIGTLISATDLIIKLIEFRKRKGNKIQITEVIEEVKNKAKIETNNYDEYFNEIINENK